MFRTISLAIATIAITATSAAATNAFGVLDGIDRGEHTYQVDLVRAQAPGIVQIQTRSGQVLGIAPVRAGANANVLVRLKGQFVNQNLVAKLIVDGSVKDTSQIRVH